MRAVINHLLYDTSTAKRLGFWEEGPNNAWRYLYQTGFGRLFWHLGDAYTKPYIREVSLEAARAIIADLDVDDYIRIFGPIDLA